MKRWLFCTGMLIIVFSILGLPLSAGGQKEGVEAAEQVTVTMWTAFPELHEFIQRAAKIYMERNPNIVIEATLFPQRAQEEKVAVALPAGEAADLIELDKFELYPYYLNDHLEQMPRNVTDFVKSNFPAYSVEAVTSEKGELYCVPWMASIKVMFYNKDYFAEAGLKTTPKTIDEQMEFAKKLVKYDAAGNITRVGLDLRLSGGAAGTSQKYWCQAMIPYGANIIEKVGDKWKAGYANERGYNALKYYIDAVFKHKVESQEAKSDAEGFGLGVTSMFQRESWVVGYLRENAPNINYGVFLMPKGPGGWGTVGNTMAIGVPKSSKVKKEAFDFLLFLLGDEMQIKMFDETGWQPFRVNIDYSRLYEKAPALKTFMEALDTPGHKVYDYENMPAISEIHNRLADRVMVAFKSEYMLDISELKKAVNKMSDETNRILDDYGLLAK